MRWPRLRFGLLTLMASVAIVAVGLVVVGPPRDDKKAMRAALAKFTEATGCIAAERVDLERVDAGWKATVFYMEGKAPFKIPWIYEVFVDRHYKAKEIDMVREIYNTYLKRYKN